MKVIPRQILMILVTGLLISGISGCATTNPQIEEAMSMARAAQSDAAAARKAADAANRAAEEAKRMAGSAQKAASAANSAADQANGCCAANSEKLDRMFRESMKK